MPRARVKPYSLGSSAFRLYVMKSPKHSPYSSEENMVLKDTFLFAEEGVRLPLLKNAWHFQCGESTKKFKLT